MLWRFFAFEYFYPLALPRPSPWIKPGWLWLLMFKSCGLYSFIWFYRNWRYFKAAWNNRPLAFIRSLLLLVPLLNILIVYDFCHKIQKTLKQDSLIDLNFKVYFFAIPFSLFVFFNKWTVSIPGIPEFSHWLLHWFLVYVLLWLPSAYWIVNFQKKLNLYWEQKQPMLCNQVDYMGTGTERLLIFMGGFTFWGQVVMNAFLSLLI